MKVDEEAYTKVPELEVRLQLSFVLGNELLYGFHFDDDSIIDNEISPIGEIETHLFVEQGNRDLFPHRKGPFA